MSTVAFRVADHDTPLWALRNTRAGRWNHAGRRPTQYVSLEPSTCWAEALRYRRVDDVNEVRSQIWALRLDVADVLDLTSAETLAAGELERGVLTADDQTACRDLADALAERVGGIRCPSAARPGGVNVVLFGARRAIGWADARVFASEVPVVAVAIGRPPRG